MRMAWPERYAIGVFCAALFLYGSLVVLAIVTNPSEPMMADDWRNVIGGGAALICGVTAAAWAPFRVTAYVMKRRGERGAPEPGARTGPVPGDPLA